MGVITCEIILGRESGGVYYREWIKFHCSAAFCETLLNFTRSSFDPAGDFMGIGRIGVKRQSLLNLPLGLWEVPEVAEIEIGQGGMRLGNLRIKFERPPCCGSRFVQLLGAGDKAHVALYSVNICQPSIRSRVVRVSGNRLVERLRRRFQLVGRPLLEVPP